MTAAIRCDELTKRFGPVHAVDGVSFRVEPGEVVGFLGPNGAGKTTTIRMVLDLIRPSAGRIEVLGADPRRAGAPLRQRIGYVAGDLALYDKLTGLQHCELVASLRGMSGVDAFTALAERLDLPLDRPVGTLSRGNRQKLGVVQALAPDPELLVLDEPTSGLDPLAQREFRTLVRAAVERGAAVLWSSHVLAEVQRVADRVAIIRRGRLLTCSPVHDLEAKALRMVEIRFDGPVDAAEFAGVAGVRDVVVEGDLLRAKIAGPADALVKAAARFTVESIAGHEADLEDVFLDYYTDSSDVSA